MYYDPMDGIESTQGSVDLKEETKCTNKDARHIGRPVEKWKASTQENVKRGLSSVELPHMWVIYGTLMAKKHHDLMPIKNLSYQS